MPLSGFSHGYEEPESLDDIAENLHSFMKQWIKLFPEFEVRLSFPPSTKLKFKPI